MTNRTEIRRRTALRRTVVVAASALLPSWLLSGGSRPLAAQAQPRFGPDNLAVGFKWSLLLSLHTHLRVLAERSAPPPQGFVDAVAVYRKHRRLVPDPRIWLVMESHIARAPDIRAVGGVLTATFPNEYREFNLGPTGREVSAAMAESLPVFESSVWPAIQERRLKSVDPTLKNGFQDHRQALLTFLFTSLNVRPLDLPRLDIDLVGSYPGRGHDTRQIHGQYFTIVETERFPGSDLVETVVMQMARILELESQDNPKGTMWILREKQRALHLPNPALLPQAVLYWTSGEAVRRLVDPEHEHVGAKNNRLYGGALRPFVVALREVWNPYLDGKLGLDEAIERLIEKLKLE